MTDEDDLSAGELPKNELNKTNNDINEDRFRYYYRISLSVLAVLVLLFFLWVTYYLIVCWHLFDPYIIGIFVGASTLILYKAMSTSMPNREKDDNGQHPLVSACIELANSATEFINSKK